MATTKLGQLCGINIVRIPDPVGVRVRCEFVSIKHRSVEFEIAGDLAFAIAMELEMLLPISAPKRSPPRKRQRVPVRQTHERPAAKSKARRKPTPSKPAPKA
jgi:hypothetical protein